MSAPSAAPRAAPSLPEARLEEFLARAALLGHDAGALLAGEEVETFFTLPTVRDVRRVMSVATDAQRRERQRTFFNPPVAARRRLGQGLHDRGEAVVFADGVTPPEDEDGIARHMPARVKAVSVLRRVVPAGETWDVSVRGARWGLDDLEELYCTANVGELVLEPGARIVVRGNVFSLLCQRLVRPGADGEVDVDVAVDADGDVGVDAENPAEGEDWAIGVLPTPFTVDTRVGGFDGRDGAAGADGVRGRDGAALPVENSLLGLIPRGEPAPEAERRGADGTDGGDGEAGGHGRNGGMCKVAEVTLREVRGRAPLYVRAGAGLPGGHGGDGGRGGDGGDGAPGHRLVTGRLPAAPGGRGGRGGDGGRGGNGGSGGIGSNVYLVVPPGAEGRVPVAALPSEGAPGGRGGRRGAGGRGGAGGGGPEPAADGAGGADGADGRDGLHGRARPAPWVFVNERRAAGDGTRRNR